MTDIAKSRSTTPTSNTNNQGLTVRARRRREEAVRRLVADVQSKTATVGLSNHNNNNNNNHTPGDNSSSGGGATTNHHNRIISDNSEATPHEKTTAAALAETHDWVIASTVATALEKGLDRDFHTELIQEAKDNAGRIGQVCHDHADVFLASVAQVAALATPSADLADGFTDAQTELRTHTVGPMHQAACRWEEARQSYARARTVMVMVDACQGVAVQLERARKQAGLGRPRAALEAVDRARTALTKPLESLFDNAIDQRLWKETIASEQQQKYEVKDETTSLSMPLITKKLTSLEQTPFGKRAATVLPKIEQEVLMSAKRGLNRWFMAVRNNGDGAKAGRCALRETAHAAAAGPGALGLGGTLPASFLWRAQMAENWIARATTTNQGAKVARACRLGYYFDRDATRDVDKLQGALGNTSINEGCERYAEAIAVAFGWYRCWEDGCSLLIDPAEFAMDDRSNPGTGSRHGGLSGSRHGIRNSRHGPTSAKRSLGFRATTNSRSQAYQEISSTLGSSAAANKVTHKSSLWTEVLVPSILFSNSPTRYDDEIYLWSIRKSCVILHHSLFPSIYYSKEEDEMLRSLPETVHPVRRAEVAYSLLDKTEEFVVYYEQNRFGESKIGGEGKDAAKSALSALTGDDISVGSDRTFFAKTLPQICAAIVGFCAVESALELSNFSDDRDYAEEEKDTIPSKSTALKPSRFRESSERYERTLMAELGHILRQRCERANLGELVRTSRLLVGFRAALKLVHPSSTARRVDKEMLNLDSELVQNAIRIAQDEQLKATMAIVDDDQMSPMLVADAINNPSNTPKTSSGIPDPECIGLPFGLGSMKQVPQKSELDFQEQSRTSYNQAALDEMFTFSHSVPVILRSIHSRAITCAAFALSQNELNQKFPDKRGSSVAAFVFDCVEESVGAAVIGMKDNDSMMGEASVEKTVQVMANISALQHSLPRLFGTLIRGCFHVGLVRADEADETFAYAEKALKAADKACDAQVGSTYSMVYEICRTKIDSHINISLENFNWVAKATRESPNPYCESLVGYLKTVFAALGPMDEGSRAGLHFSCCGHVSERLVMLLSAKPGDVAAIDDSSLSPITKIDAFGIKNLLTDCEEFERFADYTGIPSLRDCFSELRILSSIMLDKELPTLLLPDQASVRRRKYPILSLDKVVRIDMTMIRS